MSTINSFIQIVYRHAYLSTEAYKAIMRWLDVRGTESDYIFLAFDREGSPSQTRHMTAEAVWQTVQGYADLCGLSHIKPHDFRRFVGTQLAQKNIHDAKQALGHKRISTTEVYVLSEMKPGLTEKLY